MLTHPPTTEDILIWQQTADRHRPHLSPNRRSTEDTIAYLEARYPISVSDDPRLHDVVAQNILQNDFFSKKRTDNSFLSTRVYIIRKEGPGEGLYNRQDSVFQGSPIIVGLESNTKFVLTEGSSELHDELIAYAGLDAADISNNFLVWEYIECLRTWRPEDSILRIDGVD